MIEALPFTRTMPTISSIISVSRESARCRVGVARMRMDEGRGAPNADQLKNYIDHGAFWMKHIPDEALYFKHHNAAYQQFAIDMGFFDAPQPVTLQLYVETLQKFRLSALGVRQPFAPEQYRNACSIVSIRCRTGTGPSRNRASIPQNFPIMRSRSGRWRCITPGARRMPGCGRSTRKTICMSPARFATSWG